MQAIHYLLLVDNNPAKHAEVTLWRKDDNVSINGEDVQRYAINRIDNRWMLEAYTDSNKYEMTVTDGFLLLHNGSAAYVSINPEPAEVITAITGLYDVKPQPDRTLDFWN